MWLCLSCEGRLKSQSRHRAYASLGRAVLGARRDVNTGFRRLLSDETDMADNRRFWLLGRCRRILLSSNIFTSSTKNILGYLYPPPQQGGIIVS